jgi:hypothetical protein
MTTLSYFTKPFYQVSMAIEENAWSLSPYLFIIILFVWVWLPVLLKFKTRLAALTKKVGTIYVEASEIQLGSWFNSRIILAIAILSTLFLMSYRYFQPTMPIGYDTPFYMSRVNDMLRLNSITKLLIFSYLTRFFIIFMPLYPLKTLGLFGETVVKILPSFLGVIYVVVVYLFVKTGTNNAKIAALSSLFAAVSFFTLRLSLDLFVNFFAMSLIIGFLMFYLKTLVSFNKRDLIVAAGLLAFLLFVYPTAWIISTGIISSFFLISIVKHYSTKHIAGATLKTFFPSLVLIGIMSVASPMIVESARTWFPMLPVASAAWQTSTYFVFLNNIKPVFAPRFLSPEYIVAALQGIRPLFDPVYVTQENAILWLLTILGILLLSFSKRSYFKYVMISWVLILSVTMSFTSLDASSRIMLYYPTPILSAITFYALMRRFKSYLSLKFKIKPFSRMQLETCFLILVFLLFLNSATIRVSDSRVFSANVPSDKTLNALYWIRDHYDGRNTILVVSDSSFRTFGYWPVAITGAQIYRGNLLDLLSGKPDNYMVYYPNPNNYTILLISDGNGTPSDPYTFYNPDFIERQIINRIYENVFVVRKMAEQEIKYWNSTWYAYTHDEKDFLSFLSRGWTDDNFYGWDSYTAAKIPPSFSTDGDVMTLTVSFTPKAVDSVWIFKTISLATNEYPYLFARVRTDGPIYTPYIDIRIWYTNGSIDTLEYHPEDNNWHTEHLLLTNDKTIASVGICFTDYGVDVPNGTYHGYVDFITFANWDVGK